MTSIREPLCYGGISPCPESAPTTKRYIEAKDEVERLGEGIIAKYPDCKELLESCAHALHITAACGGLQDFERGLRLGVLIMVDVSTTE